MTNNTHIEIVWDTLMGVGKKKKCPEPGGAQGNGEMVMGGGNNRGFIL